MTATPNTPGEPTRYAFWTLHRCPVLTCGSTDHIALKGPEVDDTGKSQRRQCRACGHKFIALFGDGD